MIIIKDSNFERGEFQPNTNKLRAEALISILPKGQLKCERYFYLVHRPLWEPGYEIKDTRENFNFPSAVNYVTNQISTNSALPSDKTKTCAEQSTEMRSELIMNCFTVITGYRGGR